MSEQYTINHFSLSLPEGQDQGDVAKLLKHLAKTIETSKEKMEIQDIVFHSEIDDKGNDSPSFTIYYYS